MPDIFLRPGAANPSDLTLRDTTIPDAVATTGTATWDQAAPSWAAGAAEAFPSAAAFAQVAATWAAASAEAFSATGAFAQAAATWSAAAAETFAASGTWTQAAPTVAATAAETYTTSAAWAQAAAAWAAGLASQSIGSPGGAGSDSTSDATFDQEPATWDAAVHTEAASIPQRRRSHGPAYFPPPIPPATSAATFSQGPASWAAHVAVNDDALVLLLAA